MRIVENKKVFYIISLVLLLPGLISLVLQGLNTGIDFAGGTSMSYKISAEADVAEVRQILNATVDGMNFQVQQSDDTFIIRSLMLTQEQNMAITDALTAAWPETVLQSSDSVGAAIGKEITRDAFLSVLIACALILLYITFRFKLDYGIAAVLALIHNVLFVLGFFSLLQWEINSSFIAAILTVVGYTINDTIVVFDRLRENIANKRRGEDYRQLLNKTVAQTINRSINTGLTCLMPLGALFILSGTGDIRTFVMAMILGFTVGAYTSLCIATNLWYEIRSRREAA